MNKWLRIAARVAKMNRCPGKNFSLGAVLVKGGSIISTGTNKKKTDPIVKILSLRTNADTHKYRSWMHAELDCINRIPIERTKGAILYVARVTDDLQLANARPCKICQNEIIKAGIRRVHYTLAPATEVIMYLDEDDDEEEWIVGNEGSYTKRDVAIKKIERIFSIQCNRSHMH